jgi:hypothetical protein
VLAVAATDGVADDRHVKAVGDRAADRADLRRFPASHSSIKAREQDRNKDS